jgi:hypothetical protein
VGRVGTIQNDEPMAHADVRPVGTLEGDAGERSAKLGYQIQPTDPRCWRHLLRMAARRQQRAD